VTAWQTAAITELSCSALVSYLPSLVLADWGLWQQGSAWFAPSRSKWEMSFKD